MPTKTLSSLVLAALIALVLAAPAPAAITVANTNDSGPGSLRQALIDAPPGETVNLPAGTYTLTTAPLVIEKSVTIAGAGPAATTLRSGGPFRIIESIGEWSLGIRDLTLRDGLSIGGIASGAAIYAASSDVNLTRVVATANTANADGAPGASGGIGQGGAVAVISGDLTIAESQFLGNRATAAGGAGKGGGITQGGAVFMVGGGTPGTFSISGTSFSRNRAESNGGQGPSSSSQNGGISQGGSVFVVAGESSTAIGASTVSEGLAEASGGPGAGNGIVQGGGLFLIAGSKPATIERSTFAMNAVGGSAPKGLIYGGGAYLAAGGTASITATGVTVFGNRIDSSNSTPGGGNLLISGKVDFRNSIVAGGGGGPAGTENCLVEGEPTEHSLGFNLESTDQCGLHAPGDLVNRDPLLGPLQPNGGPTETLAPLLGSPVIDQGVASGMATDQRGVVRPFDFPTIPNSPAPGADGSDIGAVEVQPANRFALGKLTKNEKKGTATLAVILPQPSVGTLTLSGNGLKPQSLAIAGQAEVTLAIAASSKKIKKALRKKGRRAVGVSVTYAPPAVAATTQGLVTKLIKKKKKKKKRKQGKGGTKKGGGK